jgi:hypothetical protein
MTHVLVTPERAAFLRERLKKLFAERQAAQETVDSIATGGPRSSFGPFERSFDEIGAEVEGANEVEDDRSESDRLK